MISFPSFSPLLAAALLGGCASAPLALDASHPASTSAAEAPPLPRTSLRADTETARTHALLAESARQAKAAENEAPAAGARP